jgi:hypothetical protein
VQSLGGPAALERINSLTSYYTRGSVDLNGMAGRFELHAVLPDKLHVVMDFGGFTIVRGYDGVTAWTLDHNGAVSEMGGYEKRDMEETAWFLSAAFLSGDTALGGRAYRGRRLFRDKEYHVIELYPYHRDTAVCYLDPESGLTVYRIDTEDNLEMVTRLWDYRVVESVQEAHRSEMTAAAAQLRVGMISDTVMYDIPIPLSLFSRPDRTSADCRFPDGVASVVLPVKEHRGHLFVQARINGGQPLWFLLDSGASTNLLNRGIAEALQLPEVGSMIAKGISGFDRVSMVSTDSIDIGGVTLFSQVAGAVDLPLAVDHLGADSQLGGLLGYDFLSRFPVMIDYHKAEITVFDPKTFEVPGGGYEVPFFLTMQIRRWRFRSGIAATASWIWAIPWGWCCTSSSGAARNSERW